MKKIGNSIIQSREKVLAIFDEKIEIRERCKGVHCVDLGESFPTSIYLQKSASIQPRTSPSKFGQKFNSLFTSLLSEKEGTASQPSTEKAAGLLTAGDRRTFLRVTRVTREARWSTSRAACSSATEL